MSQEAAGYAGGREVDKFSSLHVVQRNMLVASDHALLRIVVGQEELGAKV